MGGRHAHNARERRCLSATPIGKTLASVIAVLGIQFFALPRGIMGAGFFEELQKRSMEPKRCPKFWAEIECRLLPSGPPEQKCASHPVVV